jgi:DNA-binding response OmpR family regulator
VLVVDDDDVNRRLLAEICTSEGYRTIEARDGEAALAAFAVSDTDLVLLDAALPLLDGYEVCRRIVAARPQTAVLMMSAAIDAKARARATEAGAHAFASKPFRVHELTRLMRVALGDRPSPSEPPSHGGRSRRRIVAGALSKLRGAAELRAHVRQALREPGEPRACVVLSLDDDLGVARQHGRHARDAAMGAAGQALLAVAGEGNVFWTDSDELVALVPDERRDAVVAAADEAAQGASQVGLAGVVFRVGVARMQSDSGTDVDRVVDTARRAAREARRAGVKVVVQQVGSSPPAVSGAAGSERETAGHT